MSQQRIGRYEIVRPLGKGAMGVVYLARDPLVERDVALKTVRFDTTASFGVEEAKIRFLKEAKISGRLQHPHIVTVFDVGEDGGNLYLAMEYVAGGSFQQKLHEGSLSVEDRLRIVLEVAEALGHAHERGVIHRDIKPANILLTPDQSAKVTDFGIGKLLAGDSELTSTGQMVGSPSYMSPEQVKGEKLDVRTDIFSLGVVLYQALTAKKPFPADTLTTLVYQILHEEPPELSEVARDLPYELSEIVKKCLAKSRTERYSNATELAQDLGNLLGITPVTSTSSLSESKIRRAQRAATAKAAEKLAEARHHQEEGRTIQMEAVPKDLSSASRTVPTRPVSVVPPLPSVPGRTPLDSPPPPPDPVVVATAGAASGGVPRSAATASAGGGRSRPAVLAAAAVVVLVAAGVGAVKFLGGGAAPEPTPAMPTPVPASPGTPTAVPEPSPGTQPTPEAVPTEAPLGTVTIVEKTPAVAPTAAPKKTPKPKPTATAVVEEPTPVPTPALRMPDQSVTVRRYVKVNVSPSQARIFLDGKYIGISDDWDGAGGGALLTFLTEGRHRLRAAYPGFRDRIVEIIVTSRATEDRVELEGGLEKGAPEGPTGPDGKFKRPNYRTVNGIRFSVDPPNANVTIAGRPVGEAKDFSDKDLALADQAVYDVILTAPGYEPKELRILRSPSAEEPRAVVKERLKKM